MKCPGQRWPHRDLAGFEHVHEIHAGACPRQGERALDRPHAQVRIRDGHEWLLEAKLQGRAARPRASDQDWASGFGSHLRRNTTQQELLPVSGAPRRDHQQVARMLLGVRDDRRRRVTTRDD